MIAQAHLKYGRTKMLVNISALSLEALLELGDNGGLAFDKASTQLALDRLESLQKEGAVNDAQQKQADELKQGLTFYMKQTQDGARPIKFSSADLKREVEYLYKDKLSIEELIKTNPKERLSYSGSALLGAKIKEREWLIEPLLKEKSSAMVYADAGVGKTWFSWGLLVAIAGGGTFAGWTAEKARRVRVIDGEMNFNELRERLEGSLKAHPLDVQEKALSNLSITPRQAQHWDTEFYDLNDEKYQNGLLGMLEESEQRGAPCDLVVLDNFSCLADVEDENSSAAFNGICKFLNRAKTMTTVLLVHHTKKNAGRDTGGGMSYRGSSKLGGIMEVCVALHKPDAADKPEHNGAAFTVKLEKFRGLREASTKDKLLALNPDSGLWDEPVEPESSKDNKYIEVLKTGRYKNGKEIAEALGVAASNVSRAIRKAIADGVLTEKQQRAYYAISENVEPEENTDF